MRCDFKRNIFIPRRVFVISCYFVCFVALFFEKQIVDVVEGWNHIFFPSIFARNCADIPYHTDANRPDVTKFEQVIPLKFITKGL